MYYESSQGFLSWELDTMGPGAVALRVPTWQDILQIDAVEKDFEMGRIIATKQGQVESVSVTRIDGRDIQVEVVKSEYEAYTGRLVAAKRLPVFEEPVSEVEFRRVRLDNGRRMWVTLGDGVRVTETDRVKLFAELVGKWACIRQNRILPDEALPRWL